MDIEDGLRGGGKHMWCVYGTYQLRVDLSDGSALHGVQQLLQFTESQPAEFEFIQSQMLPVKQPPPQIVPAAVAHGLLHAALNLPPRCHHFRVQQREERRQVEDPVRVLALTRGREGLRGLRLGAGRRCDGGGGLLPQVQFGFPRPRAARVHSFDSDAAAEVTGVTTDLWKLLKAAHVGGQAGEEFSLTGHDYVKAQPETNN